MEKTKFDEKMKLKNGMKNKLKGKEFKKLSTVEKDALLETVCKLLGVI